MLLINKSDKTLTSLERKSMRESGYWERRDIQHLICTSPGAFCDELGEYVHIVGSEVQPTEFVQDRIDLLGVDANGAAVVIELKRDNHKLHLLQALSYAGMVAKWEPRQFIESLREFNSCWGAKSVQRTQTLEDAKDELEEMLQEGDVEAINRNQRVVLLAEEFDYEVLITCEWLTERYDVDVRCYRLALAKKGEDEFLICSRAYPPPELTDISVRRRRTKETGTSDPADWLQASKKIQNEAIAAFFEAEIANGRRLSVKYRALAFPIRDRRRFRVSAKQHFARVFQAGRFEDDIRFWTSRLTDHRIEPISGGRDLRFYLKTVEDTEHFKQAVGSELLNIAFTRDMIDDTAEQIEDNE